MTQTSMWQLYLPPSLRQFEPQQTLTTEHMCFEYDLVQALRPRVVVDVGAGNAAAFFVFCQAMRDHQIDGLCFAVDPWPDDETLSELDEAHSLSINHHARSYYRGITYLLKMDAPSAIVHFAHESIDLLRVDARRAHQPLDELLETWLPRVRPGGAALCAGLGALADLERRIWDGFAALHAGFVLEHGGGLGILLRDPAVHAGQDRLLLRALASDDAPLRADLAAFYAHAADHHALRREVRAHRFNLGKSERSKAPG